MFVEKYNEELVEQIRRLKQENTGLYIQLLIFILQ